MFIIKKICRQFVANNFAINIYSTSSSLDFLRFQSTFGFFPKKYVYCQNLNNLFKRYKHYNRTKNEDRLIAESRDSKSKKFLFERISLAIQRGNAASIRGTFPDSALLSEIFAL
jgi:hypothetical protein